MCAIGKYKPHGTLDCVWKITLKKEHETSCWYMEKVTPGKCTCIHTSGSINVITLINLPDFHVQIRKKLNDNKSMTMNSEQLQQ